MKINSSEISYRTVSNRLEIYEVLLIVHLYLSTILEAP
nr:MAG TPA: hypothetical protein [Caudoviricetes sp.]DAY99602.1 MAG TPA: hypothetical protein [Caudoviricetes sp.]